jgi:hypothetical protein
MLWLLPGELMVISFPIFEGVGVAAGVVLGLGFGVGVGGVGVGVAGFGVGVGVGGVGVGGFGVGVGVARRDFKIGRPSIAARASGAPTDRSTNDSATAPKRRASKPDIPFITLPPYWKNLPAADAPVRRSAALVFPARLPPTAGSRRSYMRDGHVSEEDRIATGRASWPPALRRQVRKIPPQESSQATTLRDNVWRVGLFVNKTIVSLISLVVNLSVLLRLYGYICV